MYYVHKILFGSSSNTLTTDRFTGRSKSAFLKTLYSVIKSNRVLYLFNALLFCC